MARRITWYGRWRRNADQIGSAFNQFRELARIVGVPAAMAALGHRIAASAKHRLTARPVTLSSVSAPSGRERGPGQASPRREGVRFIGYVEANLGLGESLRGLIDSAADAKMRFAIWPFNVNVESRLVGPFRPESYDTDGAYRDCQDFRVRAAIMDPMEVPDGTTQSPPYS